MAALMVVAGGWWLVAGGWLAAGSGSALNI
jgi:hypothetical protein